MEFVQKNLIEDLSDDGVIRQTIALVYSLSQNRAHLKDVDPDYVRGLLEAMVEALDESDEMDSFGTEGWRHFLA